MQNRTWAAFRRRATGLRGRARATALAYVLAARGRIRRHALPIAQTSVAAVVSWWVADTALGSGRAIFAPVTTIVALGITQGRRGRNAIQFVLGVALGVGVADVVVGELSGGPLQGGLVCALAMVFALAVSSSTSLVTQAGVSAILVAGLIPSGGLTFARLWQSLIGGVVALVFSQFLFAPDPVRQLERAISSALKDLAAVCDQAAGKLSNGSVDISAIDVSARLMRVSIELEETGKVAWATARQAPRRRSTREQVQELHDAAGALASAFGDVGPLLRVTERLARDTADVRDDLAALLRRLADQARQAEGGRPASALGDGDPHLKRIAELRSITSSAVVTLLESCSESLGLFAQHSRYVAEP